MKAQNNGFFSDFLFYLCTCSFFVQHHSRSGVVICINRHLVVRKSSLIRKWVHINLKKECPVSSDGNVSVSYARGSAVEPGCRSSLFITIQRTLISSDLKNLKRPKWKFQGRYCTEIWVFLNQGYLKLEKKSSCDDLEFFSNLIFLPSVAWKTQNLK